MPQKYFLENPDFLKIAISLNLQQIYFSQFSDLNKIISNVEQRVIDIKCDVAEVIKEIKSSGKIKSAIALQNSWVIF